jgi:hypothetical protein
MKKFILAAAAAIGLFAAAAPASALTVRIDPGLSGHNTVETVRHRPGHRGWHGRRVIPRVIVRPGPRCRTIQTRTVRPNGTVVIRNVRRCR